MLTSSNDSPSLQLGHYPIESPTITPIASPSFMPTPELDSSLTSIHVLSKFAHECSNALLSSNLHPMVTHSKRGIFKPKVYVVTNLFTREPTSINKVLTLVLPKDKRLDNLIFIIISQ